MQTEVCLGFSCLVTRVPCPPEFFLEQAGRCLLWFVHLPLTLPKSRIAQIMKPIAIVVDDSMLIRHAVCRYLEERGCQVESATNGEEALEMVRWVRPDIIITDLQMPKIDGYQLIQKLRAEPQTATVPIVVLAAATSKTEAFADPGADFVIFKDIDIESQLRHVLHKALHFPEGPEKSSQG